MKRIILIVLAALVVLGAIGTGAFFLFKYNKKTPPDIHDTPIPQTLDVSSAPTDVSVQNAPVRTDDATEKAEEQFAMLFGKSFPAEVYRSLEKYWASDGSTTSIRRKTFYKSDSGEVLYTSLVEKSNMAVYDANGVLIYFSGTDKPQTDYTTEPVHWFYRGGKLACGELCFYDGDNTGAAYYDADGNLVCIQTEIIRSSKKEGVQIENVFYDSSFTQIEEDAFRALLPQTEVNDFLYVNWG